MKNNFTLKFELDFEPKFESKDLSESEKELGAYYLRTQCIEYIIRYFERTENFTRIFDKDLGKISTNYIAKAIQISYEPILF